jgi:cell wall-associated NlpC family hydrolase
VIAFAVVLTLVLTGLFGHSRSSLAGDSGSSARRAPDASGSRQTGVTATFGAIPGVPATGTGGQGSSSWPYTLTVAAKPLPSARGHHGSATQRVKLLQADVMVVNSAGIRAAVARAIRKLYGVVASVPVDAGRIKVDGVFTNVLGVDPTTFRPFAAKPTATSATLWNNVAAGGMAISYTMASGERLSLSKPVKVIASHATSLPVAGFGTVGIGGVDAVVSAHVASSLGLPSDNAIVISAPKARLDVLMRKIRKLVPSSASVTALVTQIIPGESAATSGSAGEVLTLGAGAVGQGPGLTSAELTKFLTAAMSRIGLPYVWGGDGPTVFDCSGLVQWSMAQAGVVMPRVADDQARTGPLVPLRDLEPGDLLFYHTDPTAPDYISHVAIYIGNGKMLQAPEPGLDVEIVPAYFGSGFAGAIRVYPQVAASIAG